MQVVSLNINGIRAGARKGFFEWLGQRNPDVVCLQETKAQMAHLQDAVFRPQGYHCYFSDAEKKGYSGVGIFSKYKPLRVMHHMGWSLADSEGRYLQMDFGNDLSIVSLYLPSGSSGEERQQVKFDMMVYYETMLRKLLVSNRSFIICGDWNIVHREIDIKNFKSNQKNSGCLPEERAWLDGVFTAIGWVDAFRAVNQQPDQYTWWSNRGRAWDNNVGWRIDYQIVTPDLKSRIVDAEIYKAQRFSDHAPLIVHYDI